MPRAVIAHYISELNIGGAEKQLALILPYFQKFADNHVICAQNQSSLGRELERKNIPVHYLNNKHKLSLITLKNLFLTLRHIKPDILTNYLVYADITGRIIGRAAGVPTIISSQRSSLVGQEYLRHLDRLTSPFVNQYIAQTSHACQHIQTTTRIPCTTIPNPVHTNQQTTQTMSIRQQLSINKDSYLITCVANLKPGKGHHVLIEAFQNLRHTHPSTHLLIAGSGPLKNKLRTNISPENQKFIHFLGQVKNIPELLQQTDIFCLPTEGEGMSNAILEAMAASLPIITTNIPANRRLITADHTGLLCPPANVSCLTDKLNLIISNPNLQTYLGHQARQYVLEHHRIDPIIQSWQQLYQDLLNPDQ